MSLRKWRRRRNGWSSRRGRRHLRRGLRLLKMLREQHERRTMRRRELQRLKTQQHE
jgi:hypothetical protein